MNNKHILPILAIAAIAFFAFRKKTIVPANPVTPSPLVTDPNAGGQIQTSRPPDIVQPPITDILPAINPNPGPAIMPVIPVPVPPVTDPIDIITPIINPATPPVPLPPVIKPCLKINSSADISPFARKCKSL